MSGGTAGVGTTVNEKDTKLNFKKKKDVVMTTGCNVMVKSQ